MLGLLLLVFFPRVFLSGGFRNTLIFLVLSLILSLALGAALSCGEKNEGTNKDNGHTKPRRAGRGLYGSQAADPGWNVAIRTCHQNRPRTGDNAWKAVYPKRSFLGYNNFFRGRPRETRFPASLTSAEAELTRWRKGMFILNEMVFFSMQAKDAR